MPVLGTLAALGSFGVAGRAGWSEGLSVVLGMARLGWQRWLDSRARIIRRP